MNVPVGVTAALVALALPVFGPTVLLPPSGPFEVVSDGGSPLHVVRVPGGASAPEPAELFDIDLSGRRGRYSVTVSSTSRRGWRALRVRLRLLELPCREVDPSRWAEAPLGPVLDALSGRPVRLVLRGGVRVCIGVAAAGPGSADGTLLLAGRAPDPPTFTATVSPLVRAG